MSDLAKVLTDTANSNGFGPHHLQRQAAAEIERLRCIEDCAIDLIENIREHGQHDNWKRLAAALEKK